MGQCQNLDDDNGDISVVNNITKYGLKNEDGIVITGQIFDWAVRTRKNDKGYVTFVSLWNNNNRIAVLDIWANSFKKGDSINMLCMQTSNGYYVAKQIYHVKSEKLYISKIKIKI